MKVRSDISTQRIQRDTARAWIRVRKQFPSILPRQTSSAMLSASMATRHVAACTRAPSGFCQLRALNRLTFGIFRHSALSRADGPATRKFPTRSRSSITSFAGSELNSLGQNTAQPTEGAYREGCQKEPVVWCSQWGCAGLRGLRVDHGEEWKLLQVRHCGGTIGCS